VAIAAAAAEISLANLIISAFKILYIYIYIYYTSDDLHATRASGNILIPAATYFNPSRTLFSVYFLKSATAILKSLIDSYVSPTQA
jgi:hypothetical protein